MEEQIHTIATQTRNGGDLEYYAEKAYYENYVLALTINVDCGHHGVSSAKIHVFHPTTFDWKLLHQLHPKNVRERALDEDKAVQTMRVELFEVAIKTLDAQKVTP